MRLPIGNLVGRFRGVGCFCLSPLLEVVDIDMFFFLSQSFLTVQIVDGTANHNISAFGFCKEKEWLSLSVGWVFLYEAKMFAMDIG